ncbi:hypothetical protein JCGZ_00161 [Jatropha curcas]|uniref:Uncharacterized protein n=1 Tax=Jatropha curcas TaxID=180498 RepID=A0A067L2K6_JATCU|nr:hypothetical protein JCGZ_00161 [Jatropha curcas]
MDGCFIYSNEHSSPCLPIEPFEHKRRINPGLEIFTNAIEIMAVEPRGLEFEEVKKEEKEPEEEEGLRGHKRTRKKTRKKRSKLPNRMKKKTIIKRRRASKKKRTLWIKY